jgi:hypothetical protein
MGLLFRWAQFWLDRLPNSEKELDMDFIFKKYLKPYLQGTYQFIRKEQTIQISGVDFYVADAVPDSGIVTFSTLVYTDGGPIRAEELTRIQIERDEALARNLQYELSREEMRANPFFLRVQGGLSPLNQATNLLQQRLALTISQLPADHYQREGLVQLQRQLSMGASSPLMFLQVLESLRSNPDLLSPDRGADQSEIEQLPVSNFRRASVDKSSGTGDLEEHLTCRVCLSEYEEGDELRTLPCFHKYHRECIDRWISRDKKCPICKHPIS